MPDHTPVGTDSLVIDMARRFATERLAPGAAAREKAGAIEPEIIRELGELGVRALPLIQSTLRDPGSEHNHRRAALRAESRLDPSMNTGGNGTPRGPARTLASG